MNDLYATEKKVKILFKSLDKLEKKEDAENIREFAKVLEAQGLSKKRIYKYVSHLKLVSKHVKVHSRKQHGRISKTFSFGCVLKNILASR